MSDIFNINIFIGLDTPAPVVPAEPKAPKRLDPIEELRTAAGPIEITYAVRMQNDSRNGFMDFSRGDRRWLNILIESLAQVRLIDKADKAIMDSTARARTRFHQAQTWQELVEGIIGDKVKTGHDFTEGQMRNIGKLVGLLSQGKTLAGCGSLVFRETVSGKALA
jgi:hypothetical protein